MSTLVLAKENPTWSLSYFNAKELLKGTKVFDLKTIVQVGFKLCTSLGAILDKNNIVNIY